MRCKAFSCGEIRGAISVPVSMQEDFLAVFYETSRVSSAEKNSDSSFWAVSSCK